MHRYTVNEVIRGLAYHKLDVLKIELETEETDACVWLTDRISVQIPSFGGGLCVNLQSRPGEEFWIRQWNAGTIADVIKTLPDVEAAQAAEGAL